MRLPTPLLRANPRVHKNNFGHVLILAGSSRMLGAAALCSLSAMRAGAGLTTVAVAKSLNTALQKKISHVVMTWSLDETKDQTLSSTAFSKIKSQYSKFSAIAIGPGLTTHPSTVKLILNVITTSNVPLVIDADALNALQENLGFLLKNKSTIKILTPHLGEMSRLTGIKKENIERNRVQIAKEFAKKYQVILLLKGHQTVIASPDGKIYINKTGNAGMATAGSGDVLTGMIAAFLAQNLSGFEAAKFGAYIHGKAGDYAAKTKTKISMIASDIINCIPQALKNSTS
jgi:NAD(P)H-hydrate epimerase